LSLEKIAEKPPGVWQNAHAAVVLDTNAVLDAWVFKDVGMAALIVAMENGTVRWLACHAMRQELQHMLSHPTLAKWNPDSERVLSCFDRLAVIAQTPRSGRSAQLAQSALIPKLHCTDVDDQVFVDLALATQARWLVTHDKAVLKLARRARLLGLRIVRPKDWSLQ
jgi:putative PIN family toxin of toxin-antitoxin system